MRWKADEMASLILRTTQKRKKISKNWKQKPCSSEKTIRAKHVIGGSYAR